EAAGPYGQANPEPTFVIENASVQHLKILSGAHIKFAIQTPDLPFHVSAIAFRAADTNLGRFLTSSAAERQAIRLLVSAEINEFRGERTPQARIIDAAAAPI
ncbi:MAG TPA: single-stranded-DNA-specific exonuclease RecJ, partial [Beijerinckiaceae bacterium]|nr:single-stranded-DNA-specific exonuclease RecJ [Beijerinckiaceae bacterium]